LVVSAGGGRPPYEYSVDGINYFDAEGFADLTEGQYYQLRIRDAAGCSLTQGNFFWPTATRRPARLPTFIPQELAGSAPVTPEYFVPLDQIVAYRWYPADIFDCAGCPSPTVSAPRSQTISLAIDNIYGCTDSLVTFVTVDGRVPVFVPNVFTPDGDGNNDYVPIYGNPLQVERILSFRLFNRWGGQLWKDEDFAPNDGRRGWDGRLNGQLAEAAAYVWVAEVLLTTGEIQQETGTVVLLR
jgi:gliding motility-associated-like protein